MIALPERLWLPGCLLVMAGALAGCGGGAKVASTSTSTSTSASMHSTPSASAASATNASPTNAPATNTAATSTSGRAVMSIFAALSPSQIISDGAHAVAAAQSFTVAGQLSAGSFSGQITLAVQRSRLGVTLIRGSERADVVLVPAGSYLRANRAFWMRSGQGTTVAIATKLANRWFRIPAGEAASLRDDFKKFTIKRLAGCMSADFPDPKVISTTARVGGQIGVELHSPGRADEGAENVVFATAAPHYLLRFQRLGRSPSTRTGGACPTAGGVKVSAEFSRWDATTVTIPARTSPLP